MVDRHALAGRCSAIGLGKFRSTRQVYAEAGLAANNDELDRLVGENATYTFGYYRRLACAIQPHYRRRLVNAIWPVGNDHLLDAHALGRGLVLVAPHLGDFDLAVAWIAAAIGSTPVVPVASLERPFAERAYAVARRACYFDLMLPTNDSLASLTAQLHARRVVILTLDRRAGTRTLPAQFFGRPALLPAACISLARRAQAPLLTAATWSQGPEQVLSFGEAIGPGTSSEQDRDETLMQRVAHEVEAAIRRAPQQWHIPSCLEQLSICGPDSRTQNSTLSRA